MTRRRFFVEEYLTTSRRPTPHLQVDIYVLLK